MIRKINRLTILTAAVMAATLAGSANAAIVIHDETTFRTGGGASTYTYTNADLGNFDVTGYDKLVLVASAENMNNLTTVRYGDVDLIEAVTATNGSNKGMTSIWYLDNPTMNGSLFIDGDLNGNGIGGTILGLTGTQTGVGNTDTDEASTQGNQNLDFTLTATLNASLDSIVIGTSMANGGRAVVIGSPQTEITAQLDSGSSLHNSGYQLVDPAGSVDATFTLSRAVAAAEFKVTAIPEPASLAMGLVGLTLVAARRRRS